VANDLLRLARERVPSPARTGEHISRKELADLASDLLFGTDRAAYSSFNANYVGKLENGVIRWPCEEYRAALRTALHVDSDEELGFSDPHRTRPTANDLAPQLGQSGDRPAEVELNASTATRDARTAALFARQITAGAVDTLTLEQIDADIRQLARRYVSWPMFDLFDDIRYLRSNVFELLNRNRLPGQMRQLYVAAARLCGLQAHVCLDLGYYAEADTHARAALQAADAAGHHGVSAWVRALQSLIAYWDGRPSDAIQLAAEGANYACDLSTAVRLRALTARAAALTGDNASAIAALNAAEEARGMSLVNDETGGVFAFPEAKQATYAGTTLTALDAAFARRAIAESTRALALYQAATPANRSTGDILAAHLDLATAYLTADDLDAAADQITHVLAIPSTQRTASIRKRARGVATRLSAGRYTGARLAHGLRDDLAGFCAPTSQSALPAPRTGAPQ
jgi:hypothetical protein